MFREYEKESIMPAPTDKIHNIMENFLDWTRTTSKIGWVCDETYKASQGSQLTSQIQDGQPPSLTEEGEVRPSDMTFNFITDFTKLSECEDR